MCRVCVFSIGICLLNCTVYMCMFCCYLFQLYILISTGSGYIFIERRFGCLTGRKTTNTEWRAAWKSVTPFTITTRKAKRAVFDGAERQWKACHNKYTRGEFEGRERGERESERVTKMQKEQRLRGQRKKSMPQQNPKTAQFDGAEKTRIACYNKLQNGGEGLMGQNERTERKCITTKCKNEPSLMEQKKYRWLAITKCNKWTLMWRGEHRWSVTRKCKKSWVL